MASNYFWSILLSLLQFSGSPKATFSANECQQYLLNAPVELQCGALCSLYASKGLLEGYIRNRLSTTYAHLALAAYGFEVIRKYGSLEKYALEDIGDEFGEAAKQWHATSFDPIIAFGAYGIYLESEFPQASNADIFRRDFGQDLSPHGIQLVVQGFSQQVHDAIKKYKSGDQDEARRLYAAFSRSSLKFIGFVQKFRAAGMRMWNLNFGRVKFEWLANIPVSSEEKNRSLESIQRFLDRRMQAVSFRGNFGVKIVSSIEMATELKLQLNSGQPAVMAVDYNEADNSEHATVAIGESADSSTIICRDNRCFSPRHIDRGILQSTSFALLLRSQK